jgi:nucleoside-diphosphate-sugar epimerase
MTKIIGNGMIAKSFGDYTFSKNCLLIAAGVSNSLETRFTEFQREENLIREAISHHPDRQLIYFSTCSIFQLSKTPYIAHKLNMEKIIAEKSTSHLIFRLPQAVGVVKNSTLVSFLVTEILKGGNIAIQLKAKRNLIGVDDVARIVHQLIERGAAADGIINIAAKNSVFVLDIVIEIARILDKKYNGTNVDAGESYEIPIDFIEMHLSDDDPLFEDDYWKKVLMKFVPRIAEAAQRS